jgi:hypothetical protein
MLTKSGSGEPGQASCGRRPRPGPSAHGVLIARLRAGAHLLQSLAAALLPNAAAGGAGGRIFDSCLNFQRTNSLHHGRFGKFMSPGI